MSIVDGNEGTVNRLITELKERNELEQHNQQITYYYSGKLVTDRAELTRIENCLTRLDNMIKID